MPDNEELIQANIQEIADKGANVYDKIKERFVPKENGKFLAIDIESEDVFLGTTSAEALTSARESHPGKIFYVVKIGSDVAETLAEALRR